jgi:hypothetical protein
MIRDFRIDTSGFCQRGGVWLNAADSRSAGTYAPSPVQIRALAIEALLALYGSQTFYDFQKKVW